MFGVRKVTDTVTRPARQAMTLAVVALVFAFLAVMIGLAR